jgi:ABC-type lipoprotein export system ATPase subunit
MQLVLKEIVKHYPLNRARVEALRGVSISFGEGEVIAIVGPSGSGKSTLLHIAGLIDEPTSGMITMDGKDISQMSEVQRSSFRRDFFGFVFQSFHLIPVWSSAENVAFPALLAGKSQAYARERSHQLLEKVGLKEEIMRDVRALSGGQRQRVAIARAMMNSPQVILADEPTGNLDGKTGKEITDLMVSICRTEGSSLLMATHDPELIRIADRVIELKDGLIVSNSVGGGVL